MQKSIEVRLYNKCHKINLSSPFAYFLFYITPTVPYLWVWTIETSSLPNYSMQPLIKQIQIFSGIQTVYFNCKYFSLYTRELLGCLLLRGQLNKAGKGQRAWHSQSSSWFPCRKPWAHDTVVRRPIF